MFFSACGSGFGESPRYVGSRTCQTCHEDEYKAWQTSDHALAMSVATDSTVLGVFDGTEFSGSGATTAFSRSDDGFVIESREADGSIDTLLVTHTFGYWPLQQLLVDYEGGRLQSHTVAWNTVDSSWFSLYPDDMLQRGDYVHWSGPGMNWNYMCAECHSTDLKKGYVFESDTYETTYEEINVACEACHGPAENHLTWANEVASAMDSVSIAAIGSSGRGLTFALRNASPSSVELNVCARCHSRRSPISDSYSPGDEYLDHFRLSLLEEGLYYADGQIDDEVYVYGSFLQSKMYQRGVRCSNCHNAHSGQIRLTGNALCTQCHVQANYDTEAHLRHKEGSEASQCVTCHMPSKNYMVVDPRRDHAFKIPRPEVSARIGAPDVCRSCHTDRAPETLAADIRGWNPDRTRADATTTADLLFRARRSDDGAIPLLNSALQDTSIAPIMRASLVSLLGRYPVEMTLGIVARELRSSDSIIRLGALNAASELGPGVAPVLLEPLLLDSVAGVRLEAVRLLALLVGLEGERIDGFNEALVEYRASLSVNDDQPGTHVNFAVLEDGLGDKEAAKRSYENALRFDSLYAPALLNLGLLLNRELLAADNDLSVEQRISVGVEAARLFRRAARSEDEMGGRASYYLGLLLAEDESQIYEAARQLERAAKLVATNSRMYYNAGLAFQSVSDREKAELYLSEASKLNPLDPDPINALVILFLQNEEWQLALEANDRLATLLVNEPGVSARRDFISEQIQGTNGSAKN